MGGARSTRRRGTRHTWPDSFDHGCTPWRVVRIVAGDARKASLAFLESTAIAASGTPDSRSRTSLRGRRRAVGQNRPCYRPSGSPGRKENGSRSNRRIIPGRFALVVSRWHCIQTSICRSGLKRAGLTMAAWISGFDAFLTTPIPNCRDPGPWQRWQSGPPTAPPSAVGYPLWQNRQLSSTTRVKSSGLE